MYQPQYFVLFSFKSSVYQLGSVTVSAYWPVEHQQHTATGQPPHPWPCPPPCRPQWRWLDGPPCVIISQLKPVPRARAPSSRRRSCPPKVGIILARAGCARATPPPRTKWATEISKVTADASHNGGKTRTLVFRQSVRYCGVFSLPFSWTLGFECPVRGAGR